MGYSDRRGKLERVLPHSPGRRNRRRRSRWSPLVRRLGGWRYPFPEGLNDDERVAHRVRFHRRDRRRRRPLLGGADPALAPPLLDRSRGSRPHAERARPGAGHLEEGGRTGERGVRRRSTPGSPTLIVRAADEVIDGTPRRPLPPVRVADRLGHADQHERERGHLEPRDRAGRGHARIEVAGASQRPREHVAVLERHVPDGHAHRGGGGDRAAAPAERAGAARRARSPRRGVRRHREDRPHAPAGCRAAHARSGVRRLRGPTRRRHRAARADPARSVRAGGRRHGRRHGIELPARVRRGGRCEGRRAHGAPVRDGAQQVRGARLARCARVRERGRGDARGEPDEDRERHAMARLGSSQRARRAACCPRTSRVPRSCRAR